LVALHSQKRSVARKVLQRLVARKKLALALLLLLQLQLLLVLLLKAVALVLVKHVAKKVTVKPLLLLQRQLLQRSKQYFQVKNFKPHFMCGFFYALYHHI
jgi:hypothetical protein